jgi:uroporphyrin-III C-methyltransferase/precorrin-2 dehydrogenase/sirohydrochlorin ferrochelatase
MRWIVRHFPIFLDLRGKRVVVSGAGAFAAAKLQVLLKTEATISVFGELPDQRVLDWAREGRLSLIGRTVEPSDLTDARLLYAANNDSVEDARAAGLGRSHGCLVNIVDNLEDRHFISPAIVDRDPIVVAIGTEGAAPVLARQIKAANEERLPRDLGVLARLAKAFRAELEVLPFGAARRAFWSSFFSDFGPSALARGGEDEVRASLRTALDQAVHHVEPQGRVTIAGAGPGDPDLLTMKARRALHECDVVVHDRLVAPEILELARREAAFIEVGKIPGGPSWSQDDINAVMTEHASGGAHVVRIKSGDPTVYGRLDEEMDALDAAGISFEIIPGITSASAGAAAIKASMTKRRRNSSFRFVTGQDVDGFAEHDWKGLAQPGAAAAIYMGVRAARFIQGRLMIHGATPDTPITAIENISRSDQKIVSATVATMIDVFEAAGIKGPAILFLGLSRRKTIQHVGEITNEEAVAS